jgi:hypothetical protein
MRTRLLGITAGWVVVFCCARPAAAGKNGAAGANDLVIVNGGKTRAVIAVSPAAGAWEKRAAGDLARFIRRMSGANVPVADSDPAVAAALKARTPVLVVGRLALAAEPGLRAALAKVAKKEPVKRADAIVVRRAGNRVYLAGLNDDCHYYAAVELLRRWGCRWYLPGELGECVPDQPTLKVGRLDYAYASPFEMRAYWVAWGGSSDGVEEFQRRNGMNRVRVPAGHALGRYVKGLIPKGGKFKDVPITAEATAAHVAKKIAPDFAAGRDVSLAMDDSNYESTSAKDQETNGRLRDKYFLGPALADSFLVFYNYGLVSHRGQATRQGRRRPGSPALPRPVQRVLALRQRRPRGTPAAEADVVEERLQVRVGRGPDG